jgi:pyruvate/2-oxoglutarate/acetoin dehydrogenase E1 component
MDQLVNQAAKMRYMFGGRISLPMVVRLPAGGGISAAAQHSQSLEAWLTHVPGLKVVYPSTPQDALGLMLSAIDDQDPVMFVEHKTMYALKGEVTDFSPIPLGKGDIKRQGADVTVIATGKMVHEALAAAAQLEKDGIDCEVLDPRSLFPLDKALIKESVAKTHKVLVLTEENKRGGYGGEISATISEEFFDLLDGPVVRIGALNTPIPFAVELEKYVLPNAKDVVNAVKGMM